SRLKLDSLKHMNGLKNRLIQKAKSTSWIKSCARFIRGFIWLSLHPLHWKDLPGFVKGYYSQKENKRFGVELKNIFPIFFDKSSTTPLDPVYFYQDAWCAQKIFEANPVRHVDVGSSVKMLSIIAQKMPVTFVDIRPIEYELPGLSMREGSILDLPFENESIVSLSSICVVEHIGLGRYGDAT